MSAFIEISICFFLGISVCYTLLILVFNVSWFSIKTYSTSEKPVNTKVSVVLPVRNESENILQCLEKISSQNYPTELFEIIVVDDSSTDNTVELLRDFISKKFSIKITLLELSKFNLSSKYPCKNINCLKFCGLFNINSKIFFVHQYLCNCNDTIINKLYLSDTTLVNNNGSIFINKNDNNIYEYNLSDIELINKLPYNIIITNITYCDLYKKLYILVSSVNKYTKCTNQGDEQSGKNPLLARTPPPEITDNSYLLHLQWFDVLNIFGNTLLFTNNETNDLFSLNNNPYGILSFFDKLIIFSDIINSSEKINDTSNDSLGGLNSCKYTILQILN